MRYTSRVLCKDADLHAKLEDIEKSVFGISRVEPLEVSGDTHPRYMVAPDRIRLMVQRWKSPAY